MKPVAHIVSGAIAAREVDLICASPNLHLVRNLLVRLTQGFARVRFDADVARFTAH
ncbi:MAG TPA: hypothetical protein VF118_05740 [Gemmatimonadaceae bacterium]